MTERIEYLQIHHPRSGRLIRDFITKCKPLGIEGYERIWDATDNLCFMLGHVPEGQSKPVYVAGIRTQIREFGDEIERSVRQALGMG